MKDDLEAVREGYMGLMKELVEAALDRQKRVLYELCPPRFAGTDEKELLRELAKSNQRIAALCDRMRLAERQAGGRMGVPAVAGGDLPNPVRTALAFLAARTYTDAVDPECRTLGSLAEVAAGSDPKDLLALHDAFRRDGVLRPLVHFEHGRTIAEIGALTLTEEASRRLLALSSDPEME